MEKDKINYYCNNNKEFILTQKELFKKGYKWVKILNKYLSKFDKTLNTQNVKNFENFPIIINCHISDKYMLYDTNYNEKQYIYYDLGRVIYANVFLRKHKLKKLKYISLLEKNS